MSLAKPAEGDRYRTEDGRQENSGKKEELQRNLILVHVPFST
jgi:hypothetical protein